jgi:hypothetical protein
VGGFKSRKVKYDSISYNINMRIRNKRKIITFITLTAVIILIGIGYFSGFLFNSGITPCLPPPNYVVDGVASARIYTWIDSNSNGVVNIGEKPLPNVEIIYPVASSLSDKATDNFGSANTYDFRAGCVCRCWEGSYVIVATPDGYIATTPTRVELTSDQPLLKFGFIKENP